MEDMDHTSAAPSVEQTAKQLRQAEVLPWVEKYRPSSLEDVVAHEEIVRTSMHSSLLYPVSKFFLTVSRLIDENRLPHLLFYGPPGTGKTSTILACARKIYGSNMQGMVLEVCL